MNDPMNQIRWFSETMHQWTNEQMNQWIHEPMNHWTKGWMNEWMDGRIPFSLLIYFSFFTERPLRWGTPSLSYFFFEQTLIWCLCSELPSSFVASATQFFSWRSCCNVFSVSSCNPAKHKGSTLWSRATFHAAVTMRLATPGRLPTASQHHSCFAARSRANAFCHSRLQTRIAGASHTKSTNIRAALTMGTIPLCSDLIPSASCDSYVKSNSRFSHAHFADLIF